MEFGLPDDNNNISLKKFESMLKTNNVLFFDSNEFENIIHHYLEIGKIVLAKKAIKLGLDQHPSSTNLKLFQTEIFVLENRFDEANKILETIHSLEPDNEEIYIQKANVLSKQDQHEKAVHTLLIALDLSSNDDGIGDLYALIGMEYLFLDQFENAKTYFKKCLDIDIEDYSALYNIVYCYDFLGENEEAITFLNKYLDKNPYCEVAWHQLGRQYVTVNEQDKALAAFEFAIISDDSFVGAYLEKGKVLEKKKLYHEAIENYKITLALEEPTSFALLRIGHCYDKLEKYDLAVQYYYKTVHEDPLLDKGWIAITKFYNRQKNYQKALNYINKAINIDSENVVYWKLYAQINLRLNFLEEAERGFKKTLDLGNYELQTWLSRADVLITLGEYEASILNLIQASEFYPDTAEIEFRLAGLNFTLHEHNKGHYHLKNGMLLNQEFNYIIEELFPNVMQKPSVKQIFLGAKK
ncbi:tetratricopeptide repeat protein [Psychroserpens sp. Hel_I_66]|uniref:tetratricopeptide repeat protein n=1 Tax=Psychroserpens sp. Hel_I_66 TaxID=1250004 RepID=UPI000647CE4B|nr:tetratricopeptide repeat protein [Psychroserpens sp. Hel_I_66]